MAKAAKKQVEQTGSFIKFLGTAGARFVMIRQLRSSGGIWVRFKSTNIIIDPGPGALVRSIHSRPKLDPCSLDGIILTHKHLDHSGDVNVLIEAMSQGGSKRKGVLFAPSDSVGPDGVVFSYLQGFPQRLVYLEEGDYTVGDISFVVPVKNKHPVQTYGIKMLLGGQTVSVLSDTGYFDGIIDAYRGSTVLIVNVVFSQARPGIDHLSLDEALTIIKEVKPQQAVLTHFGMTMLTARPHELEKKIREELPFVRCAYDGFTIPVPAGAP